MNIKERILSMDKYLVDNDYVEGDYIDSVEDLLLTIEVKDNVYSPCCYVCEDSNWATFLILSMGSGQCMSVRKSEIICFGIYNGADPFDKTIEYKTVANIYQ